LKPFRTRANEEGRTQTQERRKKGGKDELTEKKSLTRSATEGGSGLASPSYYL
jgi:hypothetical protein